MIGNKMDTIEGNVVKSKDAEKLCDELGILDHLQTSAITGENINDVIYVWWKGMWNFASNHHKRKRYPFYECNKLSQFVFERTRKPPQTFI